VDAKTADGRSACPHRPVKVWRYTAGFMHQKALLIDDRVACIGTANFDNRSFRLNFEITVMVVDRDFNQQVQQIFVRDFERSEPMDPMAITGRSFWFQLKSRAVSLFAPIL